MFKMKLIISTTILVTFFVSGDQFPIGPQNQLGDVQIYTINDDGSSPGGLAGYQPSLGGEGVEYKTFVINDAASPPSPLDIIRQAKQLNGNIFGDVDVIEEIVPVRPQAQYLSRLEAGEDDGLDYVQDVLDDSETLIKADFLNGARKRRIRFTPVFHG